MDNLGRSYGRHNARKGPVVRRLRASLTPRRTLRRGARAVLAFIDPFPCRGLGDNLVATVAATAATASRRGE
jgi:hypothetical protein